MNVIEAIQEQCNFIRNEIIPKYDKLGAVGAVGRILLRQEVKNAEDVIASGDTVQMIATLESLRATCETAL